MKFGFVLPALALAAASAFTAPANAVIPVYPDYKSPNTESYDFTLVNSGALSFYYLGGETVSYRAIFGYSVNGGAFTELLDSNLTAEGTRFDLGNFNAGDVLEFRLRLTKPAAVAGLEVYSTPEKNEGGLQQVWLTGYNGGDFGVPVGDYTLLSFEDILGYHDGNRKSDFDYNDQRFAFFQNEFNGVVPEPATWAMLIAGFGMVGFAMRRRKASISVVSA